MRVGVPKEIKDKENRVALTPEGARQLVAHGHRVSVQSGAGSGSGFDDEAYRAAGADTVSVDAAWDVDLVLKVKEPLESEYPRLKHNMLFTYLHLAGVPRSLTEVLLERCTTAIAYETVADAAGRLPLLAPMSAVAGNMAVGIGNYYLARFNGGKGMLLGDVLGRRYGKVVVIGDGVVGRHAAHTADAMGASVSLFGRRRERASEIAQKMSSAFVWVESNPDNIGAHLRDADLVVGGVLVPGAKAPHVVSEEMVRAMQPGSVIVDVSIDQGGCVETSRPTSHSDPVYTVHDVIHYCVTNMPGAYPRTSTIALTAATLPYAMRLADRGLDALREDAGFARGVNTHGGFVSCRPVAAVLGMEDAFRELGELVA